MNYYCLIAGLPDLQIDNAKHAPSLESLHEEWESVLSSGDLKLLSLLRRHIDNRNLLTYMADKEAELNPLGVLSREDWAELTALMEELDEPKDARLEPYMVDFYRAATDEKTAEGIASKEDLLATLYFDQGTRCKNKFVADWFEFNLNLNNVLAAVACRTHKLDVKNAIVGSNEVANTIRNNSSRDFGLTGIFEDLDAVMAIAEEKNLLERERKLDALKWAWLEEHTFFNYFTIERVLSFYLRCELLHRWDGLTMEKGQEIFRSLLDEMKKGVKF